MAMAKVMINNLATTEGIGYSATVSSSAFRSVSKYTGLYNVEEIYNGEWVLATGNNASTVYLYDMRASTPVYSKAIAFPTGYYLCKFELNGKIYIISTDSDVIDNVNIMEIELNSLTYNGNDGFDYQNKEKVVYVDTDVMVNKAFTGYVTKDNSKLIVLKGQYKTDGYEVSSGRVLVVDMNTIMSAENETTIGVKQTISCPELVSGWSSETVEMAIVGNTNDTRIQVIATACYYDSDGDENKFMKTLLTTEDTENIIAIKYKNQYFSKVQPQLLSAGGPDVRAGKTFIGWMGYPETGTLEV